MTVTPRKLIEVSLPLEAINRASAREKYIHQGHPSSFHLWWARKPLAAARAILFAQLVDDPSAHPDRYPTEEDQERRRGELHALIEKLVVWENSNEPEILAEAHKEILDSTDGNPPGILDPFAGGGTIPMEAQRLGLDAVASDVNPVAVLMNKALIEIPPKFKDRRPVYPGLAESQIRSWNGVQGLAADVRAYGEWLLNRAQTVVGELYPDAALPDGSKAPVIAWIWARTVGCPNPRCRIEMPLVQSWWLGRKEGKESYVIPVVVDGRVQFRIGHDAKAAPTANTDGTVARSGAICVSCRTAVDFTYIRAEGRAGRIGTQLMAIVAEGARQRIYLPPNDEHVIAAHVERSADTPDGELPTQALGFRVQAYGFLRYVDLFTARQLTALTTLCDLVAEAREQVFADALSVGKREGRRLADGGSGAAAYADAVATYLSLVVSRLSDYQSSFTTWASNPQMEILRNLFARQAIPMA
jgi:putative DNA methylase